MKKETLTTIKTITYAVWMTFVITLTFIGWAFASLAVWLLLGEIECVFFLVLGGGALVTFWAWYLDE